MVLAELEKIGFHSKDVKFMDGYFIFEHGKDMVVHFHIKECKGWKFGIWWDLDGEESFDLFAQYERDIDKFKPSASHLCLGVNFNPSDLETSIRWQILPFLKFIKKHPYVAWKYDQSYCSESWDYVTDWEARLDFWRTTAQIWKRELDNKKFIRKYKKLARKICQGRLENWEIVDENQNGLTCWPRFFVSCDGFVGEKTEPGVYSLNLDFEVEEKLKKKIRKFDNKLKKKGCFGIDVEPFNGRMSVFVRKNNSSDD